MAQQTWVGGATLAVYAKSAKIRPMRVQRKCSALVARAAGVDSLTRHISRLWPPGANQRFRFHDGEVRLDILSAIANCEGSRCQCQEEGRRREWTRPGGENGLDLQGGVERFGEHGLLGAVLMPRGGG